MEDVKTAAPQTRRARARATQNRIIDHAYRLFCDNGYPSTTIEAIAAEAGVATQTVYYFFRTKALLLQQVVEVAAAGEAHPLPVMERPWMRQILTENNARRALALIVEHGVDIYIRVAPLRPALEVAAASDPDVNAYWRAVAERRKSGMRTFVERLAELRTLQPDLTVQRATDVMFVINSHEVFLGLTRDSRWSVTDFKRWLYDTLTQQLLDPTLPGSLTAATAGLSFHEIG
jgi:TetR/AcrR family transcriptional regulator, regulator of autoinduction and epiphytic fitness